MSLYTVISPRAEYYQQYEDFIKNYKKVVIDVCIKEFGTLGNHPHLNIIWHEDTNIRTDKFTEKLKRHMKDLPDIELPPVIRTKKIVDIGHLLGSYLVKEACHEVLIDTGKYDLSLYRQKYGRKIKVQNRFNGMLSYVDAVSMVIDYLEENEIDYIEEYCLKVPNSKFLSSKHCSGFKMILCKISKEHGLHISHLLRKSDELHVQLLAMLVADAAIIDFDH